MKINMFVLIVIISVNMSALAFTQTNPTISSYEIPEWVYSNVFIHNLPTNIYQINTLEYKHQNIEYPYTRPVDKIVQNSYESEKNSIKLMNEAFIDAFNDVYYDKIQKQLLTAKSSETSSNVTQQGEMEVPIKFPNFDDYSIPSWVYQKVFKHNRPRKFKEKNYIFWDKIKNK